MRAACICIKDSLYNDYLVNCNAAESLHKVGFALSANETSVGSASL